MATAFDLVNHALAPLNKRRLTHQSTLPHVLEDSAPAGCHWEFDYDFEQEDADDAPLVLVTAVRFVAHDGTEYPIRAASLCQRWLAEIEYAIGEEVAARNEAAALSLR